jgi:flagellar basal-body rod modification protein FlgD
MAIAAANTVAATTQSISSAGTNAGSINGAPGPQPDRKDAETAPQFGEVLQGIQSKYGARPEKGREIKKTLGKDDFLRIMITQMKNQDPTNPFKAEQMAAEMAQFTTVEQLKNMNESLVKMSTANQPLERMAMTGMIGKTITVDRGRFPHMEGVNDSVSFGLPRDAAIATLSLVDEHGETVLTKELGKLKAGENSFNWDGKKLNSLPAKSGNYRIVVEATDNQGMHIDTDSSAQAKVIGVSFEGSEPVFLVGDNKHQEKVTMKSVVRIDSAGDGAGNAAGSNGPGFVSSSQNAASAPKAPPAFFNFQKGVGSTNLDSAAMSAEAQKAIASYQANGRTAAQEPGARPAAPPVQAAAPPHAEERGFPNGLQDPTETTHTEKGGNQK